MVWQRPRPCRSRLSRERCTQPTPSGSRTNALDVGQQRGQRRRWCDRWTVRPLRCCQHRRQQLLRSASHRHDEMQSAYDGVRRVVRSALHLWLLAALPEGQDRLRSSLRQRGERAVGCVLTEEHVPSVQRSELATPRDAAYTNVISAPRRVERGIPRPQRTRNTTFDEMRLGGFSYNQRSRSPPHSTDLQSARLSHLRAHYLSLYLSLHPP